MIQWLGVMIAEPFCMAVPKGSLYQRELAAQQPEGLLKAALARQVYWLVGPAILPVRLMPPHPPLHKEGILAPFTKGS